MSEHHKTASTPGDYRLRVLPGAQLGKDGMPVAWFWEVMRVGPDGVERKAFDNGDMGEWGAFASLPEAAADGARIMVTVLRELALHVVKAGEKAFNSAHEVGPMGPSDHDNPDKFRPGEEG